MTAFERENLIISIENSAAYIASENKPETVDFILAKYGAESIKQIPDCYLSEVFNELDAIEADIRSGQQLQILLVIDGEEISAFGGVNSKGIRKPFIDGIFIEDIADVVCDQISDDINLFASLGGP